MKCPWHLENLLLANIVNLILQYILPDFKDF